jgi:hypothetical protein
MRSSRTHRSDRVEELDSRSPAGCLSVLSVRQHQSTFWLHTRQLRHDDSQELAIVSLR